MSNDVIGTIALMMGVGWASGINLYAAILTLGVLGSTGHMVLPPNLEVLTHPMVMGAAAFMYVVEFFADKVPGLDSAWDAVHTFIRIPAGAVLAAQAVGPVSQDAQLTAALLGGTLAAGSHMTKAGTRILLNTIPEPFTNWLASIGEDLVVVAGVWTAVQHPVVFLILLAIAAVCVSWALPRLWRGVKALFARLGRMLRGERPTPSVPGPRL